MRYDPNNALTHETAEIPKAFEYGRAICYSGYREGQAPGQNYPTEQQIIEDFELLKGNWKYLRMYDAGPHAQSVLKVIRERDYPFKVMLGTDLQAEVNNPECSWAQDFSEDQLLANRKGNDASLRNTIELANEYADIAFCVSIGNEASVFWNDHMVPVERLVEMAKLAKKSVPQPITFCENYVPWAHKLEPLAEVLDVLSVHTYPVWEYHGLETAMDYTKENFYSVANKYPHKPVIITEAGWASNSNGRGMEPENASDEFQKSYLGELLHWADHNRILSFVFEAFDEPWKGSDDPMEPEKHWGIYREDRSAKPAVSAISAARSPGRTPETAS